MAVEMCVVVPVGASELAVQQPYVWRSGVTFGSAEGDITRRSSTQGAGGLRLAAE